MAKYVGIDLGTTFSVAAYIDETGRPKIIEPDDNRRKDNLTPSCVANKGGKLEVGEFARREWGTNDWGNEEQNAAARFKRDMETSKIHKIGGKNFTPTELSAEVLKKIKEDAEKKIGPIAEAVVTIPANFSHEAREATINAARMAGLTIKYIINEPTAAALYHAYQTNEDLTGTCVVFDLGGGTFDVSVIKLKGQDVEVIASNGIAECGGMDFDKCLWKLISSKYKEDVGAELLKEDFPINDAEELKKSLSIRKRATSNIEEKRELVDVSRLEFEECISALMAQIEMTSENVLDEAGVQADEITSVFLVGGSTRIPCVQECAKKVFKQDPVISTVSADEAVALGACLYAAYKSDGANLSAIQKKSVSKINLTEAAPYYLGTIAVDVSESKGREQINSTLIEKNQKIPCSVTKKYRTLYDGQERIECRITVSVGRETDPNFVNIIEKQNLALPPNRPAGQELEITYSIDENGMFHGYFKDISSGREKCIKLSMTEIDEPTQSGIDKFLVE